MGPTNALLARPILAQPPPAPSIGAALPQLLGLALVGFWIWMIVDCLRNPKLRDMEKRNWVLVILFLNVIGAVIYFTIGRKSGWGLRGLFAFLGVVTLGIASFLGCLPG